MVWLFAYLCLLSLLLVWNYCAGELNKQADEVMAKYHEEANKHCE